ncbi:GGDEF domain-containing protein [Marinobacterium sp. YM272]|uniref:GGDEF domain-containing protein n=1 Tax=Marinobacterium sp. YM272 TaxID=3421654 RepID=UPI003D7FFECD
MRKGFEQRLEQANRELKRVATLDPLTGVGNRMMCDEWLADQPASTELNVIMLDIDHFKRINDRFGHERGDQVLAAVAQCLKTKIGGNDLIVRWGGEEFLLILPGVSPLRAHAIAESLRHAVEQLPLLPSEEPITLSLGVSTGSTESVNATIGLADAALYQAKRTGRNQSVALTQSSEPDQNMK